MLTESKERRRKRLRRQKLEREAKRRAAGRPTKRQERRECEGRASRKRRGIVAAVGDRGRVWFSATHVYVELPGGGRACEPLDKFDDEGNFSQ